MAEIVDFGLQQHKIKMDSRYFENVLSVVAGDTGRRIEVQLLDTNGMVQDTTGLNLRLNAVVASKATFTDATLVDAATGKYQLDLSNGMFLAPGNWQFQWQITDSAGKKLHSFAFTGNIGKNISEGGSQATNFYLNLEDLKKMQDDLINGTIDSSILETTITEKLTDLETQYAPKLTEVTAQLAQTGDMMDSKSMQQTKTVFVAHRGFNVLAPENTVASFDLAGYYGFEFVECDVRVSSDGKMVIIHDETVDRTTNGTGSVKQLTFDYIRSLKVDAGNNIATYSNLKVPTFEEYINICIKWGAKPFIHVYDDSKLNDIISILKKYKIENKVFLGTTKENALSLRNANINTTIVISNPDLTNLQPLKELGNVIIGTSNATKEMVEQIHNAGFAISDVNSDPIRTWNFAIQWGIDYFLVDQVLPSN